MKIQGIILIIISYSLNGKRQATTLGSLRWNCRCHDVLHSGGPLYTRLTAEERPRSYFQWHHLEVIKCHIVSSYSVVSIILSPFIASYFIPRFKYFKLFVLGLAMLGVNTIGFGLCYFIPCKWVISYSARYLLPLICCSVWSRALEWHSFSKSVGLFLIQGITMITIVFKDWISWATPIRLFSWNIGFSSGPVLGGFLYSLLGYVGPFMIIGSLVLVLFFIIINCASLSSLE